MPPIVGYVRKKKCSARSHRTSPRGNLCRRSIQLSLPLFVTSSTIACLKWLILQYRYMFALLVLHRKLKRSGKFYHRFRHHSAERNVLARSNERLIMCTIYISREVVFTHQIKTSQHNSLTQVDGRGLCFFLHSD